jgi:pimeloyl-ACP methyl ester carboxylesterase
VRPTDDQEAVVSDQSLAADGMLRSARQAPGKEIDRHLEAAQATLLARYAPDTRVRRLAWSQGETQVLELGAGPPLLLVHGAMSDACVWVPILQELARQHRVFAVDLPGHGLAEPFDYTAADMLEVAGAFMRDILDALGLRTANIAANSMGGLWSVVFAIDAPDRVSRLALVGAPLGVNLSLPTPFRALIHAIRLPLIGRRLARRMMSIPTRDADRKFWGQIGVVHPERLDEALLDEDVASARRNVESHLGLVRSFGNGGMVDAKRRLILGERWQSLKVPTVFLWGEHDRFFGGPAEGEAIAARNPNVRVIRVADSGHILWIDDPDRVVGEIERFVAT